MKKWSALIILVMAMFIIVLDTTVMNVSISAIVEDLNTTVGGVQSAISIYALVMASFMLTGGKLADIWGAKKTFYIGIVLFGIGTFTAAISQSLAMLIIGWSVIEGLGSALMMPNIQTMLRGNYEGKNRSLAYGVVGATGAVGAALGPIIGGFFTTFYTWRYAFLMEVVIVVAVLLLHRLLKKDVLAKIRPKFDFVGMILSVVGLTSIVLGILLASDYGLFLPKQPFVINGVTIAPFGLSVVPFIIGFGVIMIILLFDWQGKKERENKDGLFKPSLFKISGLLRGFNTRFINMGIAAGVLFTFPLFLQLTFGFSAMRTGFALMPFSLALLALAILGAKLSSKVKPKTLILYGFVFSILGLVMMSRSVKPDMEPNDILLGSLVLGAGLGFIASQIVNYVLSLVSAKDTPETTGLNGTFEQLGNAIGVALIGSILVVTLSSGLKNGVDQSQVFPQETKNEIYNVLESGAELVSDEQLSSYLEENNADEQMANELVSINAQARSDAFKAALGFLAILAILGFVIAYRLPDKDII